MVLYGSLGGFPTFPSHIASSPPAPNKVVVSHLSATCALFSQALMAALQAMVLG